mgnify:CR=1 FL=1
MNNLILEKHDLSINSKDTPTRNDPLLAFDGDTYDIVWFRNQEFINAFGYRLLAKWWAYLE